MLTNMDKSRRKAGFFIVLNMKERQFFSPRDVREQGRQLLGLTNQVKGLPRDPNRAAEQIGLAAAVVLDGHFNTEARERAIVINNVLRSEFCELSFANAVKLVELAAHAAVNPNVLAESTVVVGYGASPDPNISPRVVAYPISAIRTVENLQALGFPEPNIEIVFAQETAITVNNHGDPKVTRANVAQTRDFIKAYIETFHSSIRDRVRFIFDTPWTKHTPMTTAQIEMAKWLLHFADDPEVKAALRHIQGMGDRHRGDSRTYAAIHPFILGDRLPLPLTNFRASKPPTGYRISMGGEPERAFGIVREAIKASASPEEMMHFLNRSGDRLPLSEEQRRKVKDDLGKFTTGPTGQDISGLIRVGGRPVYYYVGGADTTIEAFAQDGWQPISNGQHGSDVRATLQALESDYALLEEDTDGRLQEFCAEYVARRDGSKTPKREQTDPLVKSGYPKEVVRWSDQLLGSIRQTELEVFSQGINEAITSKKIGETQHHELRKPLAGNAVNGISNREKLRRSFADAILKAFPEIKMDNPSRRVHEVMTLALKIFDTVITTPGIKAIHFDDLEKLANFALGVAVNPDSLGDTVINIGLGGDPHPPSARIYPYLQVPLNAYRRIDGLFEFMERDKFPQEITQARIIKEAVRKTKVAGVDFDRLERSKRMEWINQANAMPSDKLPELTPSESQTIKDKCGVTHRRPRLRVFLATNAAIEINHDADPEAAKQLLSIAEQTVTTLTTFIREYYPDVFPFVEFVQDRPLRELPEIDQALINNYCSIIQISAKGSLAESLRGFAEAHAGGDARKSLLYAALHPSFYQHNISDIPTPNIYGPKVSQPPYVLSFGGPTEERFYAIMEVIEKNVTSAGFLNFINEHFPHLRQAAERRLMQSTSDRSSVSIRLTTESGTIPPYYQAAIKIGGFSGSIDLLIPEVGLPNADVVEKHIQDLEGLRGDKLSPIHRAVTQAVIFDYRWLKRALQS